MKNKIVIITYQSYMQEARPHSLETMEYIADEFHMIEEFKIVEISGMIAKDESEVVIKKDDLQKITIAASNAAESSHSDDYFEPGDLAKTKESILTSMKLLNA
jgi:hypothetical protein